MELISRPFDKATATRFRKAKSAKAKAMFKGSPGRPTASELERRKTFAIKVATDLFMKNGYAATSLHEIAKDAGVSRRTICQHFGDKEAMFREIILAHNKESFLQPPTLEFGSTLFSALGRVFDYIHSETFHKSSIALMRLMIAESNRFPALMRSASNSIFDRFRRNIAKSFFDLEGAGLIPPGDHNRSAELFVDLVLGSSPIMTYTSWDPSAADQRDRDERVSMFILGRFGQQIAAKARTRTAKLATQV